MTHPLLDIHPTRQANADVISKLRAELRSLRHRNAILLANNPKPGALTLYLSAEAQRTIHREATMRARTSNDLALHLLELIARDNLFAAVLDK